MTVQAPLIYGYPLKEWTAMSREVSSRRIHLTFGQFRSLLAIGDMASRCDVASSAVREAIPRISRPKFSADPGDGTDFVVRNNPWTLLF